LHKDLTLKDLENRLRSAGEI